jgi:hypothetical protein
VKLQLWTTVNGNADELLGEVDVDDEEWNNAQAEGADARELILALASEMAP